MSKTALAVKLHTLLDLRGNIPCFVRITHGKTHDVTVLDHLPVEPGAFDMIDRGYVDFGRLYKLTMQAAFFVTRPKKIWTTRAAVTVGSTRQRDFAAIKPSAWRE